MTYKSILLQVEPNDHALTRLKCATQIADRFDSALMGLAAECIIPLSLADPYNAFGGEWAVALNEQMQANFRAAEENFRSLGGPRKAGWTTHRTMPADALMHAARGADLIIAGGSTATVKDPYSSADVGKVILCCGRPVLVAPPETDYCPPKTILVACSDTRESRRAVADALPFLTEADDVVVLELCQEGDLIPAQERTAEVAAALARHGVRSRALAQELHEDNAASILLDHARRLDAGLIVAGAYGHSRLGEWVFGGVTRDLLAQTERFVLFGH